jgi:hypothetical protein
MMGGGGGDQQQRLAAALLNRGDPRSWATNSSSSNQQPKLEGSGNTMQQPGYYCLSPSAAALQQQMSGLNSANPANLRVNTGHQSQAGNLIHVMPPSPFGVQTFQHPFEMGNQQAPASASNFMPNTLPSGANPTYLMYRYPQAAGNSAGSLSAPGGMNVTSQGAPMFMQPPNTSSSLQNLVRVPYLNTQVPLVSAPTPMFTPRGVFTSSSFGTSDIQGNKSHIEILQDRVKLQQQIQQQTISPASSTLRLEQHFGPGKRESTAAAATTSASTTKRPRYPPIKIPDDAEAAQILEMEYADTKRSVEEWKKFRLRVMSRLRKQRWRAKKKAEVLAGVENTKLEEEERLRRDRIRKQLQRAKKRQKMMEESNSKSDGQSSGQSNGDSNSKQSSSGDEHPSSPSSDSDSSDQGSVGGNEAPEPATAAVLRSSSN